MEIGSLTFGYCTNVHAGVSLGEMRSNLDRHAVAVKRRVSPDAPMGVGLWLSAPVARALRAPAERAALRDWLDDRGLRVFTLNGFPYGDFHRRTVKRAVYRPDWRDEARLDYTRDLIGILADLLEGRDGEEGSISTLPLGWGSAFTTPEDEDVAGAYLRAAVLEAAALEARTGRVIHLDLEPEPGCVLDTAGDVARFFERQILDRPAADILTRHLRVCHDVCHGAVMHEPADATLSRYADAGIRIGKLQVSSAPRVDFDALDAAGRARAHAQLAALDEPRYLHQTTVRAAHGATAFYDDLPDALAAAAAAGGPAGEWRVHFHLPIYLERVAILGTTRDAIDDWLGALAEGRTGVRHVEVETYAWEVLPSDLQRPRLADGIAEELTWLAERWRARSGGAADDGSGAADDGPRAADGGSLAADGGPRAADDVPRAPGGGAS